MAIFNSYVSEIRCSWTTHNGGLLPFSGNVVVQGNPDLKLFHTGLDNKTGDGLKPVKPYKSIICVYIYIPIKNKKKIFGGAWASSRILYQLYTLEFTRIPAVTARDSTRDSDRLPLSGIHHGTISLGTQRAPFVFYSLMTRLAPETLHGSRRSRLLSETVLLSAVVCLSTHPSSWI